MIEPCSYQNSFVLCKKRPENCPTFFFFLKKCSELKTSLPPPSLSHTQTHKTPQKAWVQFFLVFIESSISLSDESRFFRFLSMTDPLKSLCMTTERRIQLMSGEGGGGVRMTLYTQLRACQGVGYVTVNTGSRLGPLLTGRAGCTGT